MSTQAEAGGLQARTAAATRLMHVCIGAGPIGFDFSALEETGRGLRALYDAGDEIPATMAELLKRLD